MNEIAIDPSPTAEATRFTLPARTSPTAKTQGRLVSSKYGTSIKAEAISYLFARRNGSGLKDSQEGHQIRLLLLRQVELLNQVEKLHCVLECQ